MTFLLKIFFQFPEKIRFILVGGFNTVFGFAMFTLLHILLSSILHYLITLIISNFIATLVAFLMLKFFVFQTQGNYLKEFIRCYITYLTILILNALLLYVSVDYLNYPIVLTQFCITIVLVIISYLGHKYFSFTINHT